MEFGKQLSRILQRAQGSTSGQEGIFRAPTAAQTTGSSGTSSIPPKAPPTAPMSGQTPNPSIPSTSSNKSPANPTSLPSQTGANIQKQQQLQEYVLLGVKAGKEIYLAQLEVQFHQDIQFFKELRREYAKLRGAFRRWFSIWGYSHCDFVKVLHATLCGKIFH